MGTDTADAAEFSRHLAALKDDGCNVLVVNDPNGAADICDHLLGGHDLERRHVYLPTTTDVDDVLARHEPRRTTQNALGVADATAATTTRSVAATSGTATATAGPSLDTQPGSAWYSDIDDLTDLETVFDAVHDHVDRIAPQTPAPGELRLCVDSLDPFFDAADEQTLFRFIHGLTNLVRKHDGMGHYHAAAGTGHPTVAVLEPLFDATVYVETTIDGDTRQRWRLHDPDIVSDWMPLD
ncbi:DUF7504 family protein [Halocalculus aciditolerans]|uniref:Uncharacterized protein n=1 Tax=Halocalculus aciditolerans TaxID=1383812 RepID=A0A830FG03_9EURY|nr:hypothetical protein [Halocalculus aciditolerans]GGL70847.1 hypothetical protein GCM10009039_31140 [Halocalculus aciditolerans]